MCRDSFDCAMNLNIGYDCDIGHVQLSCRAAVTLGINWPYDVGYDIVF